jgi:hypothetical protein
MRPNTMLYSLHNLPLWADEEAHQLLESLCHEYQIPIDILQDLVVLERQRQKEGKRRNITHEISQILERLS